MAITTLDSKPAQADLCLEDHTPNVQRFHPNSRVNRIAALAIGESLSESVRINFDQATRDEVNAATSNLRSALSKAADRAAERSNGTFTTETGSFFTRTGDIIVTSVVTRLT